MSGISIVRKVSVYPWLILALVLLAAFIIIARQRTTIMETEAQAENFQKALTDTVFRYRQRDGSQKATITAFQSRNKSDFLKLKSSEAEIKRLQTLVSSYGSKLSSGTAATFTTATNATTSSTTVVTAGDTVYRKDSVFVYPIYSSSFALGKWIQGNTIANKDSTIVQLRTYNEYDVVVGETGKGFLGLGKREVYADVITHSPYDSINRVRAFKVAVPPQKKLGIGFSAGYGINTLGQPMIYVGAGLNYNLIRIK